MTVPHNRIIADQEVFLHSGKNALSSFLHFLVRLADCVAQSETGVFRVRGSGRAHFLWGREGVEEYEKRFEEFLQSDLCQKFREELESLLKKTFVAGWIAALDVMDEREKK